ncbi:calcium-binding protein [Streptomyces sp. NPDC059918]|uniref:calcium-binding protein n=1 Tax=Streptomyces sp. NPDC059918 TaxID=3347003 RepID=UPI0036660B7E
MRIRLRTRRPRGRHPSRPLRSTRTSHHEEPPDDRYFCFLRPGSVGASATGQPYPGPDALNGAEGDDQLFGGNGNDAITGGNGNDLLDGEAGNGSLTGNNNDDVLNGGAGNDNLNGNAGANTDNGVAGNNVCANPATGPNATNCN